MVVVVGLTVMLVIVAPLLHKYDVPPVAVSVVLDPVQISVSPLILGVGREFTVTVTLVDPWQPLPSVTVTLYVVVAVGLTVMLVLVAPLLQL